MTDLRRRIVVATGDALTERMAGPGMRALNIARVLAADHDVRLVTTAPATIELAGVDVRAVDDRGLRDAVEWCDVLVGQGWVLAGRPFVTRSEKVIVADAYDPMHLEQLEQGRDAGDEGWWAAVQDTTAVLNEQLLRADLVLCASGKQRDFWLGQLAALGRVNPATYAADQSLAELVAVVPFGVESPPPVHSRPALRGVLPGIGPDDRVVLWGGGVWNWLDPLSVIRAVDALRSEMPTIRLVFMGLAHPNPDIPRMQMAADAVDLATQRGLNGVHVFFNQGWTPYAERHNVLLEADVGVSAHIHHIETEFSFRTRVLDYLWAGLPVVVTNGDAISELVADRGLGVTVDPGDVDGLADGLRRVLDDAAFAAECRRNAATVAEEMTWERVLTPLAEFCRAPRRAPDLADGELARRVGLAVRLERRTGAAADARRAIAYLRAGGPALVAKRAWARAARVWRASRER